MDDIESVPGYHLCIKDFEIRIWVPVTGATKNGK